MRVCFCVRVQATPCVTFWSVRGATVSHTLTLHGATASTAHSPSQDQHIAPLLLHHRSSFNTFFFLFLCAILTLNCPTNTSFPVYMISTQSCQIRWWENRSEIVLELLLLCNIGFRYVKPYWSIMFHIEMCLMYFYNIQIHICQLISIVSEKKVSPEQAICFFRQTLQKILVKYGSSWRFFERRMLPRVEIEIAQLFPIQQLCFSKNRSRDLKIAHVGAYRSYVHMGLAACLETLWSKPPLLRMALLDFTPSP